MMRPLAPLLVLLLAGCASYRSGEMFQGQPPPEQPEKKMSAAEKAFIGTGLAGLASTHDGLERGCREANPLFAAEDNGEVLARAALFKIVSWAVIKWVAPERARKSLFWIGSAVQGSHAIRNASLDCGVVH